MPEIRIALAKVHRHAPHVRFRSVGCLWPGVRCMKKKLTLGKKTLLSIALQIESILQSLHNGEIEILKINPHRTDTGVSLLATYRTRLDPLIERRGHFAHQRVAGCCDVWLEGQAEMIGLNSSNNAA